MDQPHDVVVLGGGLAGLTLALQLKRARPETSVLVAEKRAEPPRTATFKVGESTVESAGYYFADVLGLRDHLENDQYLKYGLRFFQTAGDNSDITKRVELAPTKKPVVDTFQVDRGTFEAELYRRAEESGADVRRGLRVEDVEIGDPHVVTLAGDNGRETIGARWVVDAAGRAGILKDKLGLAQDSPHKINAAWLRLDNGLDLEEWGSDNQEWMGRMPEPGLRKFSTNHLMGEGYWVWLIPLATGPISIGVCADPRLHPFERISSYDAMLDWLGEHEPQLAAALEPRSDDVLDFLKIEHFGLGCERVYSPDRWGLTGEAGTFPDALYSPGSDFIAYANTFITDLVTRDLNGEEGVSDRAELYNFVYQQIFDVQLLVYVDQYPMMGSHQPMLAKLAWDTYFYFSLVVPLMLNDKMTDLEFMPNWAPIMQRLGPTGGAMEALFRDWAQLDEHEWHDHVFRVSEWPPHRERQNEMGERVSDDVLKERLETNADRIEALAVVLFHKATESLPSGTPDQLTPDTKISPSAISLHPERWEEAGLFDESGVSLAEAAPSFPGIEEELWLDHSATSKEGHG